MSVLKRKKEKPQQLHIISYKHLKYHMPKKLDSSKLASLRRRNQNGEFPICTPGKEEKEGEREILFLMQSGRKVLGLSLTPTCDSPF